MRPADGSTPLPAFITEAQVSRAFDAKTAFRLASKVFRLIANKRVQMPAKIYLDLPGDSPHNDFRAMPAAFQERAGKGASGLKWVSVFPGNRTLGLPTVIGTVLLNSYKDGRLVAVIQANALTAIRTAASAALASHLLAVKHPNKIAIVGAGLQAEYQLRAHRSLYGPYVPVAVWGYNRGEAERFCGRLKKEFGPLSPEPALDRCVRNADIVITCTPSRKPLVKKSWVKKGAHVNAIGADAKGKQELDVSLLLSAKVVVDDWEQASHSGEINVAVSRGLFSKKHLYANLAALANRQKPGRGKKDEITVFDSTGVAALDIYFAKSVYDRLQSEAH